MTVNSNVFEKAAQSLGRVEGLVHSGDRIITAVEGARQAVQRSHVETGQALSELRAAKDTMAAAAQDVLQFREDVSALKPRLENVDARWDELDKRMLQLDKMVHNIQKDVDAVSRVLTNVESQVAGLPSQLSQLQSQVEAHVQAQTEVVQERIAHGESSLTARLNELATQARWSQAFVILLLLAVAALTYLRPQ